MIEKLATVLTLLFGTEATLLTAAHLDLEKAQPWAGRAVIAASIAIGFTMFGLVGAVVFQLLALQVKDASGFMPNNWLMEILANFSALGAVFSCLFVTVGLACSVLARYSYNDEKSGDLHFRDEANFAFYILGATLVLCLVTLCMYPTIQYVYREHMHFRLNFCLQARVPAEKAE